MKVPIHITIPYTLLKELDAETKNRSRFITRAIQASLSTDSGPTVMDVPTRQLMAALTAREDCDPILKNMLMFMLTNKESL